MVGDIMICVIMMCVIMRDVIMMCAITFNVMVPLVQLTILLRLNVM